MRNFDIALYSIVSAIFIILLCAVLIFAVIFFSLVYGYWIGVSFVRSNKKKIRVMLELADMKPGTVIIDLGSGDGTLLIEAAKKGARSYGAELNPFLVLVSRIKARFSGVSDTVSIARKDIFSVSLRDADIVFLYLSPQVIEKLKEKFASELKSGAKIVSNTFPISGWIPEKETDGIFLYQKH